MSEEKRHEATVSQLIMLNKILKVAGDHTHNKMSAEVAMAEIIDILIGKK